MAETESVRLNKYIASSGFCSRREADSYIENGKVTVNGITISNLVLSASQDQSYTEISLDESGNSRIDGSITYNGVTYTTANLYIANAQATSAQIVLEMTIYFQGEEDGDDYSKAINFTYKGQTETAQ